MLNMLQLSLFYDNVNFDHLFWSKMEDVKTDLMLKYPLTPLRKLLRLPSE